MVKTSRAALTLLALAIVRNFEMVLKRVGDTTWPAGGAVPQK
jgi:hypothetical protein